MSADILTKFLLCAATMIAVCRLLTAVMARLNQPPVIAEMLTGIALGPSLFGLLLSDVQKWMFPDQSRPVLYALGQLGIAVYMFLVGLEFSSSLTRGSGLLRRCLSVSLAGISAPFLLGVGVTAWLFSSRPDLVPDVGSTSGALYIGIVVSITALPMLARIIEERGLLGSRTGTIALGAGALDDVIAWLGIGLMLTFTATGEVSPVVTALGFAAFVAVLFGAVRPGVRWYMARTDDEQGTGFLALLCALLFAACATTEFLGLHVVIGAFALGLAFPKSEALSRWSATVRPFAVGVLLPFYFVYTGLRTDIQLLGSAAMVTGVLLFLAASVLGKLGACTAAQLWHDRDWVQAAQVGVLMNTRGLIQLVALNIGLEAGLITRTVFAQLVVVAVITTVMTSPGLSLLEKWQRKRRVNASPPAELARVS
ncbi:cation:proton antiporter [Streptomyces vinaceus]|uniref:Cation:proton antiporter n=1 Tax=Streptomyces vinaceus TaxID=1960 RepID=A0A5J6JL39_STRVI|nr:cation:proton antiporter [Streptomyces vinaceus]QEV48496.1 cation:proton antiporter [Streptomyces vinaceus]GHE34964.1 cation:proton antiporter [Streptomyces vinaceus]